MDLALNVWREKVDFSVQAALEVPRSREQERLEEEGFLLAPRFAQVPAGLGNGGQNSPRIL